MRVTDFIPWLHSTKRTPLVTLAMQCAGGKLQRVEVDALPAVIGRGPKSDLCLTDHWVSKVHCCLDVSDGRLLVRDTESRHGTLVNGKTIRCCELQIGDTVTVGMTKIKVLGIASSECTVRIGVDSRS